MPFSRPGHNSDVISYVAQCNAYYPGVGDPKLTTGASVGDVVSGLNVDQHYYSE